MKLIRSKLVCSIALASLSVSTYAGTMGDASLFTNSKVVTLSVGASWAQSKSVTEDLAPEIINTYIANNDSDAFAIGELFAGLQREISSSGWLGQLGLVVAGGGNANMSGDIWVNTESDFDNYIYQYSINRVYVGLKGKLLTNLESLGFMPYLSGSIGIGFNHAFGYSNVAKIPEEVPPPPFDSYVTTTFSYTAGAGLQKAFTPNWSLGVGYEFSDWGSSSLGSVTGATRANNLKLDHLYNNAVLLSLSYLG